MAVFDVRVSHMWHDGPQVAVEVGVGGVWVPYADSCHAEVIDRWADRVVADRGCLDVGEWPEGVYLWMNGDLWMCAG